MRSYCNLELKCDLLNARSDAEVANVSQLKPDILPGFEHGFD
jgi:hypothetical protein